MERWITRQEDHDLGERGSNGILRKDQGSRRGFHAKDCPSKSRSMLEAREHLNVILTGPCITFVALNDLLNIALYGLINAAVHSFFSPAALDNCISSTDLLHLRGL
jgi:hypothetical protein